MKEVGKQLINWLERIKTMFLYRRLKTFYGWVVKFKGMEVRFNAFGEMEQECKVIP
jgi:hypothetical protein